MLGSVATTQRDYFLHRLRRIDPRPLPAGRGEIRPRQPLRARRSRSAAAEQNPVILTHSYRSWIFGRALADVGSSDV